ncbi:MAG: hypothetical protein U0525_01765 [Patescibacteria group bacterium]
MVQSLVMKKRALSSLKAFLSFVLVFTTFVTPSIAASPTPISQEVAENQKTVYELPDVGPILPNNPLFQLKRLKDEAMLVLSNGNEKASLLIQMSDKYTAYAKKMAEINKPQSAFSLFEQSITYQEELANTLKKNHITNTSSSEDMCYKAVQSNIKQAEVLRKTLDDLSASDQATLAKILEKNISARKLLEICDK